MNAFNECIKSIDNCSSLDEAYEILTSTKAKLNWDEENDHFKQFAEAVDKVFS